MGSNQILTIVARLSRIEKDAQWTPSHHSIFVKLASIHYFVDLS